MDKTSRNKKKTRDEILRATFELISDKGYLGTTTREIAQRAGVAEITLFRHFGSKERLFEEVLNRYSFLPRLREMIPDLKKTPLREGLITLGITFLKTLQEKRGMVKIMLSEVNIYPDQVREVYDRFIATLLDTLSGYFDSLIKEGTVREVDTLFASRAFLGMIYSFFLAEEIIKGRTLSDKNAEKTIAEFVDIYLNGVLNR